jgi:hypothetical protein
MALTVDERARREIARRQRRGRDATLLVRVVRLGLQDYVVAEWSERRGEVESLAPRLDGVAVRMDARVAAFVRGHALAISAWRWGPFARLVVVDEPLVALEMQAWERRVWYATGARPLCTGQS